MFLTILWLAAVQSKLVFSDVLHCDWDAKSGKIKLDGKSYSVEEPQLIQTLRTCAKRSFKNKEFLEIEYLSKPSGTSKIIQQLIVEFLSLKDNVSVFSKEIAEIDPKTLNVVEHYFDVSFSSEKGEILLKSKDATVQIHYRYDAKTNYFVKTKD
jgi:hypothetical protein